MVHESKGWNIDECILKVRSYGEMFDRNNILRTGSVMDSNDISPSKLTIFCDGSWCKETDTGGFAVVAIKENVITACRVGCLINCTSLLETEMRGLIAGLEIASELNYQEVDIVSDSVDAVWSFTSGFCSGTLMNRGMTAEVLSMFNGHCWTVKHIFRELNHVADELAKSARRKSWEWSRWDALPIELQQIRQMKI